MNRRGFLGVLAGAIAAPTIARANSLMPIKTLLLPPEPWLLPDGRLMRRSDYSELYAAMGNPCSWASGTTFRLPNLTHAHMAELPGTEIMIRALPHQDLPVGTLTYISRRQNSC